MPEKSLERTKLLSVSLMIIHVTDWRELASGLETVAQLTGVDKDFKRFKNVRGQIKPTIFLIMLLPFQKISFTYNNFSSNVPMQHMCN